MTDKRLNGKRVLVTQAEDYMGPDTIELFREHGAEIIADSSDLTQAGAVEELVANTGHIDVLVANLAAPANLGVSATDMPDDTWEQMFDVMVHPLHRLCKAVLPQMYERKAGKIVVFGSATGVKPMEGVSAYGSARFAQVGYVNAAGIEAARNNVQINLIAQNFVENPIYFPPGGKTRYSRCSWPRTKVIFCRPGHSFQWRLGAVTSLVWLDGSRLTPPGGAPPRDRNLPACVPTFQQRFPTFPREQWQTMVRSRACH